MKTFLNTIRIIAVAAVLTVGVSYVFAQAVPTVPPPTVTPAPIHTGESVQEKKGGIWSKRVLASPIALFKKSMFLPGNKSALRIGSGNGSTGTQSFTKGSAGAITQDLNTALFNDDTTIPLVIDLQGRAKPTDAIEFKTGLACPIATRFTNDKAAAFEFRKGAGTDRANIIARQVQLTGGNPNVKDVLIGDANGNARWAKASVVNGQVVFSSGVSPVIEGQTCVPPPPQTCPTGTTGIYPNCVTPPILGCTNPVAENYNLNATQDDGSCIVESDIEPFIIGCFLEDTQVTLANGTKKNIQNIKVGDQLKSVSGINTVQRLLRPKLGNQSVYSINGSEEFFTANHPFLTTDGWKSLDPETTRKEIPTLTVSLMKIGDTLITESAEIVIHSIEKTTKSTDTQLYNFELDGDHTYYANGYVVHNKIPDVPGQLCDIDPSTALEGCVKFNHNYCQIPSGATQGGCVQSFVCNTDADCAVGPSIGGGLNLVNGRCLVATQTVHPADQGRKFCKWN